MPKTSPSTLDRRVALLEAAFATFLRFGFRKTSMDDVAREAEISRQALYAYFPDKETLFRECMRLGLEKAMARVDDVLANQETSISDRVVQAYDAWLGSHFEKSGTDGSDLGEAGRALLGTMFADFAAQFERKLARAISDSPLAAACKDAKATPSQIAHVLTACAVSWKHRATSRAQFVSEMELATRLILPVSSRNK